ncbi:MAG: DUF302 domain-containing protein [Litorimonas sp.]
MKIIIRNTVLCTAMSLALAACQNSPVSTEDNVNHSNSKVKQVMPHKNLQKISPHSFDVTETKIREAIAARPLNLFGEVPHSKGAKKAGLELSPSTLFIFGNPKGGTPLMARNPEMGIELPLKIDVFEKDSQVIVNYSNIAAIVESYGGDANAQPVPNIANMLDGLVGSVIAQ